MTLPSLAATRTSGDRRPYRSSGAVSLRPITAPAPGTLITPTAVSVVPRTRSEMINRVINIILASLAIVLLLPVLLLVALAVWLTSPGPVLYTQDRVGIDRQSRRALALYDRRASDHGGSVFTIYKFRSMRCDAETHSGAVWATKNDPRVTYVGRFLRKTRLDELPQLFNVVKGDMNIVGPRPERPTIFARLRQDISEYSLRQRAKPGITGWAQVNLAYDSTIEDVRKKVDLDLEYLRRQSVIEDMRIMLRTVPVMLFKRGGW
jgi:lipopolysaccharide/colanic/teichoic acid biosynthesis glycosyltransferase